MRTFLVGALLAGFIGTGTAWAAQEEPPLEGVPPEPVLKETFLTEIHGRATAKFRGRWAGGDNDQDLYQYVSFDLGNPLSDPVTLHVMIRAAEDIDGNVGRRGYYPFDSIDDTYTDQFNFRFYYGYVDVHEAGPFDSARAGRQMMDETPVSLYFDGLRVETPEYSEMASLKMGAYGGVPVHLFESSPSGDSVFGGFLQARPWSGARARVDYMRVRDDYLLGTSRNDLVGLGVWQNLGPFFQMSYQHTLLDGDNRDLLARVYFTLPESGFQLQATYSEILETQRAEAIDVEYFFNPLQEYLPYRQGRIFVTQTLGSNVILQAGADLRELANDHLEGPFNREFRRYYLSPVLTGVLDESLDLTLTAEIWDVSNSDSGDITTGGADLTYRWSKNFKTSVGSFYSLFKYDYFLAEEQEQVRSYYVRMSWRLRADLKLDLAYEYENAEIDDFNTLRVGVSYSF